MLEIFAYGSTNCFALISGYNCYGKTIRWSNLISLFLQIIFYAVIITGIFLFLDKNVSYNVLLRIFFPISCIYNWYFTSYVGMFIFIPMMNNFVENSSKKSLLIFTVVIFVWFSFIPTLFAVDPFKLIKGYSMLWLCILYIMGAIIKKYKFNNLINCQRSLFYFCILIIGTWIIKITGDNINLMLADKISYGSRFIQYTSPFIVFAAIFLFNFFVNLEIKSNSITKIIKMATSTYFAVYIIHLHPIIWRDYIKNFAVDFVQSNCIIMVLKIFVSVLLIYVVLSSIDFIRLKIFEYLDVKKKISNFCGKIESCINENW